MILIFSVSLLWLHSSLEKYPILFCSPFLNHFLKGAVCLFPAVLGLSATHGSPRCSGREAAPAAVLGFPLRASVQAQTPGSRAGVMARGLQSLPSMWNLPEPGIRPASPVGGSTVPPGSLQVVVFLMLSHMSCFHMLIITPYLHITCKYFLPVQ